MSLRTPVCQKIKFESWCQDRGSGCCWVRPSKITTSTCFFLLLHDVDGNIAIFDTVIHFEKDKKLKANLIGLALFIVLQYKSQS